MAGDAGGDGDFDSCLGIAAGGEGVIGKYVLEAGESGASSKLGADLDAPATAGLEDARASKALIRDWTPPDASGDIISAECECRMPAGTRMVMVQRRGRWAEDKQEEDAPKTAHAKRCLSQASALGLGSALPRRFGLWSAQTPKRPRRIQPPRRPLLALDRHPGHNCLCRLGHRKQPSCKIKLLSRSTSPPKRAAHNEKENGSLVAPSDQNAEWHDNREHVRSSCSPWTGFRLFLWKI